MTSENRREYLKNYRKINKERIREVGRRWDSENKHKHRDYEKKWRINNPERSKEIQRISKKKRYKENEEFRKKDTIKRLTRRKLGKAKVCNNCKSEVQVEWHHYTEPYEINKTTPLCRDCHINLHNGDNS